MNTRLLMIGITVLAIVNALLIGTLKDDFEQISFPEYRGDPRIYNDMAITMLETYSLSDKQFLFTEPYRKSPGYPLILAITYALFGKNLVAVWILHVVLWIASIFLIASISAFFITGRLRFVPVIALACYWGAATLVFNINSDLFALFLSLLFVWSSLMYKRQKHLLYIFIAAFGISWLVITKPIVLYALPIVIVLWIITLQPSKLHTIIVIACTTCFVGSWLLYTYKLTGSLQLASSAVTLQKRADDVFMTRERISAFFVASLAGDLVADKFFPGYASDPEPFTKRSIALQKKYAERIRNDNVHANEIRKQFMYTLAELVKQHPLKFSGIGLIYILRLNTPPNIQGVEITHTFANTYVWLAPSIKIFILLLVRMFWFIFLGISVSGLFLALKKEWRTWSLIIFLVIYFNSAYALVSHGEARFVIPIIPFYFLFAVFWYQNRCLISGKGIRKR